MVVESGKVVQSAGVVVEESKNDTICIYIYIYKGKGKGTLEGEKNTFHRRNVIFTSY